MKASVLVLLSLAFACAPLTAQQGASWQVQVLAGENISHRAQRTANETYQYGFAIDYSRKTTGKKYWQYAHNYPQMGLQFSARNLGNNGVYGNAFALLPYLEFNVIESRFGIFQIKHGTGIAYASKRYHTTQNPDNLLISSGINATSLLDFGYRIFTGSRSDFKLGLAIHHLSNGGFQLPNHGMNTCFLYTGFSFYPEGRAVEKKAYTPYREFSHFRYRSGISLGFYHYDRETRKVDLNPQASFVVVYQHNTRFRTGPGLEAGRPANYDPQLALYLEEEVQFAKITTRYAFGAYAINKRVDGEDFYSKIGIAYYPQLKNYIPKGFYIGSMLKAHMFTAAHIELNTGFVF